MNPLLIPSKRQSRINWVIAVTVCLVIAFSFVTTLGASAHAQSTRHASSNAYASIRIDLVSPTKINSVTGQFIPVKAVITNLGSNATGGVAYISIVDTSTSLPIDLEDWSAQKGFYVPSIAPGQSVSLEWSVRLVTAGTYTITVVFGSDGDLTPPVTSSRISLQIAAKVNLNPNNVLPVAFGIPILLIAAFAVINYRRGKKMGLYK
jgi:hypothetical protein